MRKVLLSVAAFALAISAGAQIHFSDDFSSGNMNNWTLTDSDGDGDQWQIRDYNDGVQEEHASSASWDPTDGPLTPNNWMVSPAIDLSGMTGTTVVNWKVYGQDQSWADENYTVYVATAGDIGTLSGSGTTFNEVIGTSSGYENRSLDVTSFNGQTIYVGFRHHAVTDEFRLNIDDVQVKTLFDDDIAVTSLSIDPIVVAGNIDITGTVTNEGVNSISSFDLTWNDGSGANTETITQTIASGATYNFTHSTQLNAQTGTAYSIDVCATITGDGNTGNDCMTTNVGVVSSIPTKKTLGEEKTGTWCGWCPRGAVALAEMEATSSFVGVAVHNGDPMVVSAYDSNIGTYVPGGYPGGGVDRIVTGDPSNFSSMHSQRINEIAPASISVAAVQNGSDMEITVTADWVMTASSVNYRLGAIITEDDVMESGAGWSQVNYYDGGGAGNLVDPNTSFAWHTAGDPVAPADFGGYDHVARALGGNNIQGSTGTVPTSITDGGSDSHTYTIAVDSDWELGKCHFIGFLTDVSTGEILNVASTSTFTSNNIGIEENDSNASLSVFPNPSSDLTNIKLEIAEAGEATIEIVNTLGQVVYTSNTNTLSAGEYFYQVDVADFAAGMYTVKATVNGELTTTKLSVR